MSIFETEYGETEYGQTEYGETGFGEMEFGEFEGESPLTELQEMELAAELLEITNEYELEQFLGKLIKGVGKAVGGVVKSPIGQALGGVLKNVAKTALPVVGGALGSMVAPGIGTAIGSKLGSFASGLFELELESMEREQAEFEVARRVVRFSAAAAKKAALAPPTAPPRRVVQTAVTSAARRHAPGLLRRGIPAAGAPGGVSIAASYGAQPWGNGGGGDYGGQPDQWGGGGGGEPGYGGGQTFGSTRPRSGRWIRRGRKIVLYGV
jgi:uncharacterized protein (DUF697 family)